jgi:hypothetical protein
LAGGPANGSAAWTGIAGFLGRRYVDGTWGVRQGASWGILRSINSACMDRFFAGAKQTGTTRLFCLISPGSGSRPEISDGRMSGSVAISISKGLLSADQPQAARLHQTLDLDRADGVEDRNLSHVDGPLQLHHPKLPRCASPSPQPTLSIKGAGTDFVIIGAGEVQPAFNKLRSDLPDLLRGNQIQVRERQGAFASLHRTWDKLDSTGQIASSSACHRQRAGRHP